MDQTTPEKNKDILQLLTGNWLRLLLTIPKVREDALMMVGASVMINLLALALPLSLMQIYDRIIPNSSFSTLTWLVMGVMVAIILETVVKISRSFISNWLSARLEHILNTEVLNHFLSARLDRFEQDKAGVHFERYNAIQTIKSNISGQTLLVLIDIPFALLFLGLLYYISSFLCYLTLGIICLFALIVLITKTRLQRSNQAQVDATKENLDFVLETLDGIHTVKSLGMEDKMFRKFENIQARMSWAELRSNRWKSLPENYAPFFTQLNMLGIIFLGADLVIRGAMTVGGMTACTMLATRSLQPVIKVAGFWLRFSEVKIARQQLEEIIALQLPEDLSRIPVVRDIEGTVCFDDLTLEKESDATPQRFNALIQAGEAVGITGDNPEQTTALMLTICGMYKPVSGHIFIDEYRISAMDHSYFDGRVEYLPRKGWLFNGTILDNISMFNENKRQVALDTAALLDLNKFVADLPSGYETMVDQRSNASLPQGLIQRTCFARALVTIPRVLIIDRTLSSMDQETHDLICTILRKLKGRCTFFIVSDYGVFPFEMNQTIECGPDGMKLTAAQ